VATDTPLLLDVSSLQDILIGQAKFVDNHTIKYGLPGRVDVGGQVTAKDVIIATGSVPFVPPGAPPD
jgi:dihydrolipoamide dehydrogenase